MKLKRYLVSPVPMGRTNWLDGLHLLVARSLCYFFSVTHNLIQFLGYIYLAAANTDTPWIYVGFK